MKLTENDWQRKSYKIPSVEKAIQDAGRVYLCWVANDIVWSHAAGDAQ